MNSLNIFNFRTDTSHIKVPTQLNNPFLPDVPEIASLAAKEFQEFIKTESAKWDYNFQHQKGKMFGVLVVRKGAGPLRYLGAISGKLPGNVQWDRLIPSVFDDSTGDYFINRGMTELTQIGNEIKSSKDSRTIASLREVSRRKSTALQQRLFENYKFTSLSGKKKNLLEIFQLSALGNPPSAAGECAAPKLLNHALENDLKPVALAEFWYGSSPKGRGKEDLAFYPACKERCRPILEYMLEDRTLYTNVGRSIQAKI